MALGIGRHADAMDDVMAGKVAISRLYGALGQLAFGEGWPEPYTVHTLDLDELSPSLPHGEDVTVDPVADFFGEGEADPHAQNGEFCGQFMTPDVGWYAPLGEMGMGEAGTPGSVARLAYFRNGGSVRDVREAEDYRTWGVGTDQDDSIGMTLRLTREDDCSSPDAGTVWFDNARLDVSDVLWEFNASHGAGRWYQLYQMPYHGKVRFSFPNATNNVVARAFSSDPTEWVQSVRIDPVIDPMAELNLPMAWEPNFRLIDTEIGKNLAGPDVLGDKFPIVHESEHANGMHFSVDEDGVYSDFPGARHRVWSFNVFASVPAASGDSYAYFDVDLPPGQYSLSMDVELTDFTGTWGGEEGQMGVALGYSELHDDSSGAPAQEAATPPRNPATQWSGPQVVGGVYRPTLVMDIQDGRKTRVYVWPMWQASQGSVKGEVEGLRCKIRCSRVQIERGVLATPYEPYQRWGLVVWTPSEGGAGNPRYTAASDGANTFWAPESCDPSEPFGVLLDDGEEFDDTHRCEMWLPTGRWRFTALDRRDGPMEAGEVVTISV